MMEIDAIGTFNSTKAVYEKCFKVRIFFLFYVTHDDVVLMVVLGKWRSDH